jgi:thiosulfate/3-mercaptopyruvate sulfurtransferase
MFSLLAIVAMTAALRSDMLVPTTWLADNLNNSEVVVIDVATPEQFAANHIAGARLLDPARLVVTRNGIPDELPTMRQLNAAITDLGIGNAKRIVIYSREPLLASRAFFTFDYAGLGNRVALLDGGLTKWMAEAKPVEQGTAHSFAAVPYHGTRNAHIVADRRILRERMKWPANVMLIDARHVAEFNGDEAGKLVTHPGHIPTAKCVPWDANLEPDANGALVFKNVAKLRGIYTGIGAKSDVKLIVYCRTGMEASMTYFVLRYLGYTPALYDGSFVEWNQIEKVARAATK